MRETIGWQIDGAEAALRRVSLERRELRPDDVAVRVDYCGVCHTDLHAVRARTDAHAAARAGQSPTGTATGRPEPLVPGHEFTGVVTEIGPRVTGLAIGDGVAVGNIVDSCGECAMCLRSQENFCHEFPTLTYGGTDRHDGSTTLGGYSREYVVRDRFVYGLPDGLDPAAASPLMCAGVTVWEPLHSLGVDASTRVAVAGLGGMGHLAVKLAVALGAETTVISRTPDKAQDGRRLGAHDLIVSTDQRQLESARDRFDVLLDTIAVPHELGPYMRLVALDGTLSHVGDLGPVTVETTDLLIGRKRLSSAGSGGTAGTASMLQFAAKHAITADIELVPSSSVNEALHRLARNDVRYRFVLDMSDLS